MLHAALHSALRAGSPPPCFCIVWLLHHVSRTCQMQTHVQPFPATMNAYQQHAICKRHAGTWRNLPVAVKTVTFQDRTSGSQKSQQRAMLEAAITSSISHPNVVSTYSYDIQPLNASSSQTRGGWHVATSMPLQMATDWKLFIVQEYCSGGSLRQALDNRVFWDSSTRQPKLVSAGRRDVAWMLRVQAGAVYVWQGRSREVWEERLGSYGGVSRH